MTKSMSDRTILKVLNGLQSAAEVSLAPGEYTIGSGPDDDIQLVDVSLKPGHAKLKVSPGKVEISAAAGALKSAQGLSLAAGSGDWQEVEPLDVINAGTLRFALGPPTAQWSTIADAENAEKPAAKLVPADLSRAARILELLRTNRTLHLAAPAALVLLLVTFGLWFAMLGSQSAQPTAQGREISDLELARAALAGFPFARTLELREEVDGALFVTGFVQVTDGAACHSPGPGTYRHSGSHAHSGA